MYVLQVGHPCRGAQLRPCTRPPDNGHDRRPRWMGGAHPWASPPGHHAAALPLPLPAAPPRALAPAPTLPAITRTLSDDARDPAGLLYPELSEAASVWLPDLS